MKHLLTVISCGFVALCSGSCCPSEYQRFIDKTLNLPPCSQLKVLDSLMLNKSDLLSSERRIIENIVQVTGIPATYDYTPVGPIYWDGYQHAHTDILRWTEFLQCDTP